MKIFCDFDGTVAVNDVGDRFFQALCPQIWRDMIALWRANSISTKECYRRECEAVRTTPEEIDRIIGNEPIDPTFPVFVQMCRQRNVDVLVVSDGIDYYIRHILESHGLGNLKIYANHLVFNSGGRIGLEFTWDDPSCTLCASCKGANIRRELRNGERSVYVGDGLSDRCAAHTADILFAKKDLIPYCESYGIAYHPYTDFNDVADALQSMNLPELQGHI